MDNFRRLVATIDDIFANAPPDLREVRQLHAVNRIIEGAEARVVASQYHLKWQTLESLARDIARNDLASIFPLAELTSASELNRRRLGIAQMLLGILAEKRFEDLINSIAGTAIRIEDHRPSRTDTDYRLLNGGGNPVCRFNIKFHGTLFRGSRDFVGLEPEDCFALATYKINNALKRQTQEALPYVFVVLSVPELNASEVGKLIPDDYVWALAVLKGKRIVEESIVERLRSADHLQKFRAILARMPEASSG